MKHPTHTLGSKAFESKSLASAGSHHSNTEREVLGIIHGLETFKHCCFALR